MTSFDRSNRVFPTVRPKPILDRTKPNPADIGQGYDVINSIAEHLKLDTGIVMASLETFRANDGLCVVQAYGTVPSMSQLQHGGKEFVQGSSNTSSISAVTDPTIVSIF